MDSPLTIRPIPPTGTCGTPFAATVTLPDWFESLNTEYRYQLTPIGAVAPNLFISAEVRDHRFSIGGGHPGLKVSWQLTGVRHDPAFPANAAHQRGG